MFKRKRLDDQLEESEMMDVQIVGKNSSSDFIHTLEEWDPKMLRLLREITPNDEVQLVEHSLEPLGISPVSDYTKQIDGKEIIELAREITLADNQVKFKVTNKLEVIAEQIRFLRQQALRVLQEGQESLRLNHIPCNFRKVPGNTYYLYQRPSGQIYFSVLSPLDWHGKPPHNFRGAYIYGHDFSWSRSPEQILM